MKKEGDTTANFPQIRLRRLRASGGLRKLTRETRLSIEDLVYPIFVIDGMGCHEEIESMPGIYRHSVDAIEAEIEQVVQLGIPAVLLFGISFTKDESGSPAYCSNNLIQRAIKKIKGLSPGLVVITDVCLCEYTTHGHCGVIRNGTVDNDATLPLLGKMALSHAESGADIVAPSDMMDGRVSSIRQTLDCHGLNNTPIMAYSAKFASAFYGPFREACMSQPSFGDRSSYQMQYTNPREALREVEQDINEGADIVMVKPALSYLDIISRARSSFDIPLAAYNVSGEYSMIKSAVRNGYFDEKKIILEILTSIKRAGADIIITYHAKEAARWLGRQ